MLNKILQPIKYYIKNYLDFIFFCLFILSIPFEKRHIFNLQQSFLDGHFIEWKAYSIYLSDILFILTIIFWLLRLFIIHFEKTKYNYTIKYQYLKSNYILVILLAFTVCTALSLLQSQIISISLYRFVKLLEGLLLFIYIYKTIQSFPKIFAIIYTFIFTALIQSVIALYQFFTQKSVGLFMLGEPIISPEVQNVAKIVVNGDKMVRAYGTTPHANVLGGFLFIAILLFISLILIFSLLKPNDKIVPRGTIKNISEIKRVITLFHVEQLPYLSKISHNTTLTVLFFAFIIICFAFVITFSYSAYLALLISPLIFIGLLSLLYKNKIYKLKKVLLKLFKYSNYNIIIIIGIIMIAFITFIPEITAKFINIESEDSYTISGRVEYIQSAIRALIDNPEFGTGFGTFPLTFTNYLENSSNVFYWQLNPVHNVILLIGAELGITCLLLFILLIGWVVARSTISLVKAGLVNFILLSTFIMILLGVFVIMQLDHYFWTIQQGFLSFWLILGIIATLNTNIKRV